MDFGKVLGWTAVVAGLLYLAVMAYLAWKER